MAGALTLKSVETTLVLVPMRRPLVAKIGSFKQWPLILIDLYTHEGVGGHSYVGPCLKNAARAMTSIISEMAAAMTGKPLAPLDAFQGNRRAFHLIGYEGVAMAAVSGLDMAIWDAMAKAADQPLARLLGGSPDPVPAYNSSGLWLTDPATLAKEAAELVAEGGFTAVKLRLGRDKLADDLDAIRAVREGVGPDVKLMVDFNQGLSLGDALARCHALDDQGLYWFEEPLVYDNLAGHAQLARELKTPVQIGENLWGPREVWNAIRQQACDFVMPDLMRIGGVSGWLRTAPIAAAAGIPMSTHLYPEFSAHLMRATETAHWLEWMDWTNAILQEPFRVQDGRIGIPDRPGAGMAWDDAAVRRYRYDG
jgi:mandelate racemase